MVHRSLGRNPLRKQALTVGGNLTKEDVHHNGDRHKAAHPKANPIAQKTSAPGPSHTIPKLSPGKELAPQRKEARVFDSIPLNHFQQVVNDLGCYHHVQGFPDLTCLGFNLNVEGFKRRFSESECQKTKVMGFQVPR